jgi:hypothetical protein
MERIDKPVKVKQFVPVMTFATPITIYGWGHIKKNKRIYIGRHRARCTSKWFGEDDEKCGRKLDLENIGAYYPKLKEIHCKLCRDMNLWHDALDNELVFVHDKKTMEEQIIDKLVEERII